MLIHFALKIDGDVVGYFEARNEQRTLSHLNSYKVQLVENQETYKTSVSHYARDGVFGLVVKALLSMKSLNGDRTQVQETRYLVESLRLDLTKHRVEHPYGPSTSLLDRHSHALEKLLNDLELLESKQKVNNE